MKLLEWFLRDHEGQRIERYLSESTDLVELEYRQRKITRGEAPWQKTGITKAKGLI